MDDERSGGVGSFEINYMYLIWFKGRSHYASAMLFREAAMKWQR